MVYIQSDSERKLPHHFDAACGLYGALDNLLDVRLTSFEEVSSGKFDSLIKHNLFIGSVEFMQEVFKRVGKEIKPLPNPYTNSRITTLGEARKLAAEGKRIFIKPTSHKVFTGTVLDELNSSQLKHLSDDTEIFISVAFDRKILSETRLYVKHNQIIDARNYAGDFRILPDFEYAEKVIKEVQGYPDAYTLDLGVLEGLYKGGHDYMEDSTVVIEFNDAWAIGNYGMDNSDYYKFLRTRYFQIMRN